MENIIMQAATLGIMVLAFLAGKYIFPRIPKNIVDKLHDLGKWADVFVIYAREFMKSSTGQEKMAEVVAQLRTIAKEAGVNVTDEQLKAIAQAAYESMMAGQSQAAAATQEAAVLPGATVIINTGSTAVATDNVPEGALDVNPDGTVNAYDDKGQKVGTVDKAVADAAACVAWVREDNQDGSVIMHKN